MKKKSNLGDMYSYWANSTVNSSGVVGNHRSWNIYVTKIRHQQRPLFLEHRLFLCGYLSTDVRFKYNIKFLT